MGLPATAYRSYMESEEWERARQHWRARHRRARRVCRVCRSTKTHLHHRTYAHLGDERRHMRDLAPLCERHHHALHAYHARSGLTLEQASRRYLVVAVLRRGLRSLPALFVVVGVAAWAALGVLR